MRAKLWIVALLAVPLAGVVAYHQVQTPAAAPAAASAATGPWADEVATWNFSEYNGSVRITDTDLGWIDFAYPVTEDLDPTEDIRFDVTVEWGERPWEDRTQFWAVADHGFEIHGLYSRAPGVGSVVGPNRESSANGERAWRDGVLEVRAEVDGRDLGIAAPDPVCTNVCEGDRTIWRPPWSLMAMSGFDKDIYERMLEEEDRPIAHYYVALGGMAPDVVDIEVSWNGTVMSWERGGRNETATYYPEDFDHDMYVSAEVPVRGSEARYARNGTLDVWWNNTPVLFDIDLDTGHEKPEDSFGNRELRAPNGTVYDDIATGFPIQAEVPGRWQIWFDRRRSTEEWDRPALKTFALEWARLPWQDGG